MPITTPFDNPLWNVGDQKYWNKMCTLYRYPVSRVRVPFREIIEQDRIETFEQEYQNYLNYIGQGTSL